MAALDPDLDYKLMFDVEYAVSRGHDRTETDLDLVIGEMAEASTRNGTVEARRAEVPLRTTFFTLRPLQGKFVQSIYKHPAAADLLKKLYILYTSTINSGMTLVQPAGSSKIALSFLCHPTDLAYAYRAEGMQTENVALNRRIAAAIEALNRFGDVLEVEFGYLLEKDQITIGAPCFDLIEYDTPAIAKQALESILETTFGLPAPLQKDLVKYFRMKIRAVAIECETGKQLELHSRCTPFA